MTSRARRLSGAAIVLTTPTTEVSHERSRQGLLPAPRLVEDLGAARDELIRRGANVSEVWHDETGIFYHSGTAAGLSGREPKGLPYGSWASFSDPDGNGWLLQEITQRLPGRE